MPLSRRFSSSSQEAFTEFCSKNQPLSRRLSINGDDVSVASKNRRDSISTDKGQRVLKRRNQTRKQVKPSSRRGISQKDKENISSPEPKKRRTTRSSARISEKKTRVQCPEKNELVMLSPTPYWKVAKERGNLHSPRLTRSAKKKKLQEESKAEGDGIMLFSPPDQAANARREKLELEAKIQKRTNRIEENRKNGHLLVYSKNLDSLTDLPSENEGDDLSQHSTKTIIQKSKSVPGDEKKPISSPPIEDNEEKPLSSFTLDDDNEARDDENFSCLTKSTHRGEHSEEMMNAIKGLGQKFELLDRRLSEFPPPQPSMQKRADPKVVEELKEKRNEVHKLSKKNSKLEKENETMYLELSSVKMDLSNEKEKTLSLGVKLQDIESLNESLKTTLEEYKDKNFIMSNKVLPETRCELQNAIEEIDQYKERLNQSSLQLDEFEAKIDTLKCENDRLSNEIAEGKVYMNSMKEKSEHDYQELQSEITEKDGMLEKLQKLLKVTKTDLQSERDCSEAKKIELEHALDDLKRLGTEKDQLKDQFSQFKSDIVSKNKENNAAIKVVEEEKAKLLDRLKKAEDMLKQVSEEKEEALVRLSTSDKREDELFQKLRESDRVRKELHSRVMVLIGSIRVFVRVRPSLPEEQEALKKQKLEEIFKFPDGLGLPNGQKNSKYGCDDPTKNVLEIKEPYKDRGGLSQRQKKWSFGFDNVFAPTHSQEDIWEATEPLVQSAIDGFNVTLFAYGQTGSGKTYTMLGGDSSSANEGIITRSIRKLFEAKAKIEELSRGEKKVSMTVEMLEIYNEQVRDLLSPKFNGANEKDTSLKVSRNKAVGSTLRPINDQNSVFKILSKAQQRRTVKATSSNATSSRSHLLFTIEYTVTANDGATQVGKLNICDLAGSERLSKSGAHVAGGSLLQETKHINLSLSTLSNVIEKLQAGDKNIPYRDSKLTSLLQNSLGGNSKTLCIVCCNPLQTHFHETLCSLRFAAKINKVDLKALQNFSA